MKVFIVDDEPPAVKAIEALLHQYSKNSALEVIGTSHSSAEAVLLINDLKPNVLFLDVEMPGYSGFELLEEINYQNLMVIFVTAYRDYAVEAFKTNALDYIVKPISPRAFNRCLEKVQEKLINKQFNPQGIDKALDQLNNKSIAIKTKQGYEVIDYNRVISVKSGGSYSEFHLEDGKNIVQSKNLKQSIAILPDSLFMRISRSAIININKVVSFSFQDGGAVYLSNGEELLVGKTYRTEIFSFLRTKYSL